MWFKIQTIKFEVHPPPFRKKTNICSRLLQCILGKVFFRMLKPEELKLPEATACSCGLTTCVRRFLVSLPCPVWQQNLKLSFSVQCLRISGLCLWLLVYLLLEKGAGMFAPRDFRRTADTRERRAGWQRACCRQHFQSNHSLLWPSRNIWKGSPQIWSHLGASWLVKHLLVQSIQSNFDSRWKSHLNPCH